MPSAATLTTRYMRISDRGEIELNKEYEKAPAKTKRIWESGPVVKCACKACNSGWMQEMDEGVKPVLTPLALGQNGTVSIEGVQLLAAWATKIALVLDASQNPPVLDIELKRAFRNTFEPIKGSTIWAGAASPTVDRVRFRTSGFVPSPGSGGVEGYVATFTVLHLVLQVFCPPPDLVVRRGSGFSKLMEPIWPRSKELRWPPPQNSWLANEQEFEDLASSFESARPQPI